MADAFESAKTLFFEGVSHFHAGRWNDARHCYEASLALLPGRPSTLVNLGAALLALGQPEAALPRLDAALAAEPDDADALGHRGIALNQLRRPAEALASLRRAAQLRPERAEAWFHLGQTLQILGRLDEALAAYDRTLALQCEHAQALSNRGGVLKDLGRAAEAADSFERAVAAGADAALHAFYLAPLRGQAGPPSAPREHVRRLFDDYAEGFERHLVEALHYEAPQRLVQALLALGRERFGRTLDLGCGTGLAGARLRPWTTWLEGVDLSPAMLDAARRRGVYDALHEGDLTEHLRDCRTPFDVLVAADVFIYVGALDSAFEAAATALAPAGLFAFSVERADDDAEHPLRLSLRYAHSEPYLRRLAQRHGFTWRHLARGPLRVDRGQAIEGLYAVLERGG